jgi:hypothetical protein
MLNPAPVTQFPVLDREAAETFLQYLDPNTEEFTFQTFTDSEQKKRGYPKNPRTGKRDDPLAKVRHGSLNRHWATLVDLSRCGAGIFVTVNRTTLSGRRSENIIAIRAYFADWDGVSEDKISDAIAALGLRPHIFVESSPGKYHGYWCVTDAPLQEFRDTQNKLIALCGSDPTVFDLPRVMRLPGFPHQKDGSRGQIVRLTCTNDADDYSNTDFQNALERALVSHAEARPFTEKAVLEKPPVDWMRPVIPSTSAVPHSSDQ